MSNFQLLKEWIANPNRSEEPIPFLLLATSAVLLTLSIAFVPAFAPMLWEVAFFTLQGVLLSAGILFALAVGVHGFFKTLGQPNPNDNVFSPEHETDIVNQLATGSISDPETSSFLHRVLRRNDVLISFAIVPTLCVTLPYFSPFLWSAFTYSVSATLWGCSAYLVREQSKEGEPTLKRLHSVHDTFQLVVNGRPLDPLPDSGYHHAPLSGPGSSSSQSNTNAGASEWDMVSRADSIRPTKHKQVVPVPRHATAPPPSSTATTHATTTGPSTVVASRQPNAEGRDMSPFFRRTFRQTPLSRESEDRLEHKAANTTKRTV